MECIECDCYKTKVIDSRKFAGCVYRKRMCIECNKTFWTEEYLVNNINDVKEMLKYNKRVQRAKKTI